jgi:hypothetical protein
VELAAGMTTVQDIKIVDTCQPDGDGLIDFLVIDHPTEGVIRRCNRPGASTVVASGTFPFADFRVSLPELGDELGGGLVVDLPYDSTLVPLFRSPQSGSITVAWHQTTLGNLGATDTFPTTWGVEGLVDTVDAQREGVTIRCVALQSMDRRAGLRYGRVAFPSIEGFATQGEFELPPESEEA